MLVLVACAESCFNSNQTTQDDGAILDTCTPQWITACYEYIGQGIIVATVLFGLGPRQTTVLNVNKQSGHEWKTFDDDNARAGSCRC